LGFSSSSTHDDKKIVPARRIKKLRFKKSLFIKQLS
jgi:hypothetical protein